jgi:mercuric ion binding protein
MTINQEIRLAEMQRGQRLMAASRRSSLNHDRSILVSKFLACAALVVCVVDSPGAFAAERTIVLAVKNMHCADCPYIVKKSLESVPEVAKVWVSYKDKTAIVTYDDSKAGVNGLTTATTTAGYPSAPRG